LGYLRHLRPQRHVRLRVAAASRPRAYAGASHFSLLSSLFSYSFPLLVSPFVSLSFSLFPPPARLSRRLGTSPLAFSLPNLLAPLSIEFAHCSPSLVRTLACAFVRPLPRGPLSPPFLHPTPVATNPLFGAPCCLPQRCLSTLFCPTETPPQMTRQERRQGAGRQMVSRSTARRPHSRGAMAWMRRSVQTTSRGQSGAGR
jgi:hypothetical protein